MSGEVFDYCRCSCHSNLETLTDSDSETDSETDSDTLEETNIRTLDLPGLQVLLLRPLFNPH